jgi:capsid portal protein
MIEFKKRMKEKMGLENWREKVLRDAKGIKKNIKGNRGSSDLGMP